MRTLLLRSLDALANTTDLLSWSQRYQSGMVARSEGQRLIQSRTHAAALAGSLYALVNAENATMPAALDRWRQIVESDPLPEVRRAWIGTGA
jgi:hypothetical protein